MHSQRGWIMRRLGIMFCLGMALCANHSQAGEPPVPPTPPPAPAPDPFADLDKPKQKTADPNDPFADLDPKQPDPNKAKSAAKPAEKKSSFRDFFEHNFTFKKELFSQFVYGDNARREDPDRAVYSRQSVGFEILKKFSTDTATVAAFDIQFRFVRRDNFIEVPDDHEGAEREGWFPEIHNAYLDLYNVFNPLFGSETRSDNIGRFNFRIGRFYLPFGLNLQTDTHGSLLQLSNDRNFGYERDWETGLWGAINSDVKYDVYYLVGSGYDLSFKGQKGLVGARFSLTDKYKIDYGIEAGIAVLYGGRIDAHAVVHSPAVGADSPGNKIVRTQRVGLDWRYTRLVPGGSLAFANEISAGRDENDEIFTQLHQLEFLSLNRRWGLATQYRRFWQNLPLGIGTPTHAPATRKADASIIGEFTWYFRNDITGANLHWLKLNVEHETEYHQPRKLDTKVTIQYYRYW